MAKKSAMSKGYRKTVKKKPFLTKKEIIELVVILAVILLGIVLFNIFYDDGFIKEKDVQTGDVVSYASSNLRDRYMKLAEIRELEGFTLADRGEDDTVISAYTFNSNDNQNNIESISVNGSFVSAQSLVDTTMAYMSGLTEDSNVTAVQETTIQGYDALVFAYTYGEYDENYGVETTEETPAEETADVAEEEPAEETAEAAEEEPAEETAEAAEEEPAEETAETAEEEPADNKFTQAISTYIAVDDSHSLCFHIYRRGGDESFYLAEDELVDFIQPYTAAFELVQKDA